jgi:hypothetical protein
MTPTRLLSPISAPLGQNGDEIAPSFEIIAIIEIPLTETRGGPECRAETSHPSNNSIDYCGLHNEGGGSAPKKSSDASRRVICFSRYSSLSRNYVDP